MLYFEGDLTKDTAFFTIVNFCAVSLRKHEH